MFGNAAPETKGPAIPIIVPYDPRWQDRFSAAADELRAALGSNLTAVEHIGSTAVPAVCAKPIIDLLAIVASLTALDDSNTDLTALGYEALGENGIEGRRYFRRTDALGTRCHHLHIFAVGAPEIGRHLAFRDYLRAHPRIAARYSELKNSLADRSDYQEAKSPFIVTMTEAALAWCRTLADRQPGR
ncbi:MAG: GrpB family protein [Sphingomonadaceae bacterium]|nr:GrpB family protein [Sphingomonadaceae bacterium]